MRAFQRDIVELVVLEQEVIVALELVALDAIILIDRLAGLGIDDFVADAIAGFLVDDVEADALAGRCRRIERDGARHQ